MIQEIQAKTILNKKKKRDSWFLDEFTANAYEGCSMNCLYCYVRGSKYGENMEEKLSVKINAPEILEKQLQFRVKKQQYAFVVVSSATDAYMQVDVKYGMTKKFLELFVKYQFPVHIITKSDLVLKDIDILKKIDTNAMLPDDLKVSLNRGTLVTFSISTLDQKISDHLEPGAIPPLKRLETMQKIKEAGLLTGLNCLSVLPYISDSEEKLEEMIYHAKKYGADYVLIGGLTLFGEDSASSKTLYYKFLERYHPELVEQYKSLYGNWPYPPKQYQENINAMVKKLCAKYNIRNSILAN
ncbi:MAG: radical SAM protein [Bacteroidetes bacterium]|nr:radical SAM protein [Bacteroidota bacterium]